MPTPPRLVEEEEGEEGYDEEDDDDDERDDYDEGYVSRRPLSASPSP